MKNIPIMTPFFTKEEIEQIQEVLQSGWVAQGPKVAEFEKAIADYEKVQYAVATTSCTTALHLLLVCMGLCDKHEVIVPSFTFVATANAVEYTGATPVLAEVYTDTYNINVEWVQELIDNNYDNKDGILINKKNGKILFGIIAVNLFGLCADIPKLNDLANHHGIKIIEDSACALGASINGVHEGGFGNPSCLSFHPRKSITTGEGGMILTDDAELAASLRQMRSHGASISEVNRHSSKGYLLPEFNELGFNYRMTDIQAAVGVAQIRKYDYILTERQNKAKFYDSLIKDRISYLKPPHVPQGYLHTYQSYVCMIDYKALGLNDVEKGNEIRNKLMNALEEIGVATRQGTHAVHSLGYYREKYGYKPFDLAGAYECDRMSLTLPLYVQMTNDDQIYVIETIDRIIKNI
ncbi:DegT/DnrJ/EryC1/StrS family aminotransferase [Paenibacillus tyrfis]|uniref:DegT/DnrJ/EryC1/StrS family aminotransferase n=1 Tax=Paenibacillus tyrfis TaxID=1501230 RepID=UPI0020A0B2FD|nr:DegT/DnrJ/EryC1/StrS family aminotransferase [Paenibacillus tyrfis]MCP1309717.1 DegT/DnrJ/EryC1/StrS family aminotransferase [Paenibacillus tyrfis]